MPTTPSIQVAMMWGAIIVSVLSSVAFIVALTVAFLSKDQTNLGILIGAVVSNFTTVVTFWLGSSIGSQKKSETIENLQAKPP